MTEVSVACVDAPLKHDGECSAQNCMKLQLWSLKYLKNYMK